jgi:SMODS and SLOG-associating 2TM effector domain family 5
VNQSAPLMTGLQNLSEQNRTQLLNEMKLSKGARFNASKRLEDRDRRRTTTMAYASASVIILTLLPAFFITPGWLASALSIATVAMSLIILANSLLQAQSNDPVKADQFHRCALEINSLRRQLRAIEGITAEQIASFSTDYDNILSRYNLNHDAEDSEKYRLEHPDEFPALTPDDAAASKKIVSARDRMFVFLIQVIIGVTGGAVVIAIASSTQPLVKWLSTWFN